MKPLPFFSGGGVYAGGMDCRAPLPADALSGQFVLVDEVVHCRSADAKFQRSSADVAASTSQRFDDDLSLDAISGFAERQALGRR